MTSARRLTRRRRRVIPRYRPSLFTFSPPVLSHLRTVEFAPFPSPARHFLNFRLLDSIRGLFRPGRFFGCSLQLET